MPASLPFNPTDPVALAQALVRCPSVTPAEGGALALLEHVLVAAGFVVERLTFAAAGTIPVENLWARAGEGGPTLALAGHTDVVPPGDVAAWRHPPFAGVVADGLLHGRGAADMKGGLAALVAGALRHRARNPAAPGTVQFIITGDEEGPAINGTAALLAWMTERGHGFDACLLAEPTSVNRFGDTMKIGRRGSLSGVLEASGTAGHVAYPDRARNSIRDLHAAMAALLAPLDEGTAHFQPSNLEFTTVDVGNPAVNVIPARATAGFNVRFNDRWTMASLGEELARRVARSVPDGAVVLRLMPSNAPAFLTAPGPFSALVGALVREETGVAPAHSTAGGTSDARFLQTLGPVVELGPVPHRIHGTDEAVALADLEALARITERLLDRFLARTVSPDPVVPPEATGSRA